MAILQFPRNSCARHASADRRTGGTDIYENCSCNVRGPCCSRRPSRLLCRSCDALTVQNNEDVLVLKSEQFTSIFRTFPP